MAQRRNASSTGRGEGPSDLDDTRALAAKARSQTGGPVLRQNPAEISGVRPRRDSIIGARLTPPPRATSSEMPNWVWGVLGCLSVLLVGFVGLFVLARSGKLAAILGDSTPAVAALTGGGPEAAPPAVVAGAPDKSPLIQVIRYDGKVKMPPTGKLKPEEIAALTAWVNMGAPWPDSGAGGQGSGVRVCLQPLTTGTRWSTVATSACSKATSAREGLP